METVVDADPRVVVDVIKGFSSGYHARNGGGDTIHTDGDLPIIDVRALPLREEDAPVREGTPR